MYCLMEANGKMKMLVAPRLSWVSGWWL